MTDVTPFTISINDDVVTDLKSRLHATRWPDAETVEDWSQGVPVSYHKALMTYWADEYDHQRLANRLNAYDNFKTELNGLDIHFLHVRSSHDHARPLLLSHGWPGSIVEFLKVIGPLTEPQKHGLDSQQAFHLVIPSLPGYGFSGKPRETGWSVEKMAETFALLMARLGYDRYFAQGGDWGSAITTAIGRQDPEHCMGIHLNMITVPPDPNAGDLTEQELSGLAGLAHYQEWDSGYSKQQATRPQTLGYGLADSPSGQAAWILEKYWSWTDCDGDPENILSRDEMLDNIMVYWLNNASASSGRLYWHSFGKGPAPTQVNVPMGGTVFPKEIFRTSQRFAERIYTKIIYWNERSKGGHFAAFEQPDVYVEEVRCCFAKIAD
jgi:pimeloyl-ACP methyl ester carboxylesterase